MTTQPIDVVNAPDVAVFRERFLKPQVPVVIKGLTKNTIAGEKWNLQYMITTCGDVEVDVYDASKHKQATAFTGANKKMRFDEFAKFLHLSNNQGMRMFLFNMFSKRPGLRKEFPCPAIMRGILGRKGYMFFGAKGSKVRLHQDIDYSNVLLTQFDGRKKVLLVAPQYSDCLYKLPFNTFSEVDLEQPDFTAYPALRYVPVLECVLEPGDALFMPSGYWHQINYMDGGFSVSYRKMASTLSNLLRGFLHLCIYLPFDKVLYAAFQQTWIDKKKEIARQRADLAMRALNKRSPLQGKHDNSTELGFS